MDGTGVPVVKAETEGRPGKVDGEPAHTREAKLGWQRLEAIQKLAKMLLYRTS
jgi:hypothetical protein